MFDRFPDLAVPDKPHCFCGHEDKDHFALGCSKCSCSWFEDIEAVEHHVQPTPSAESDDPKPGTQAYVDAVTSKGG